MRKFLLLFVLFAGFVNAQTKLYVHPNAQQYADNSKSIAILPLKVTVKLRPKQMKATTPEQLVQMQEAEGLSTQKGMHSWFLTRQKRGEYTGEVQSPARTNALLKKAGIELSELDAYLPSELGAILGVDTIVTGTLETSKPMSDGAGIAVAVLFGGLAPTSKAICNLDFYNVADDELTVNYLKAISGTLGTDSSDMINILMRKVTRRIPYTGKK